MGRRKKLAKPKSQRYRPDMTVKESKQLYRQLYLTDLYREKAYYLNRGMDGEVRLIDQEIDRRTRERMSRVRK